MTDSTDTFGAEATLGAARYCIWGVSEARYAITAASVREVTPLVAIRPLARAPEWIRGLMDYHGQLLPVIDAGQLLGVGATELRMASRILVVQRDPADVAAGMFGLLVDGVCGLQAIDFNTSSAHGGVRIEGAGYLGPIGRTPLGTVQRIDVAALLTAERSAVLFDRAREQT